MTPTGTAATDSTAFIGGGNMTRSLIGGMVSRGIEASRIHVAEPVDALREALARDFGVTVHADAAAAAERTGTWVFAVKPQVMRSVCEALAGRARETRPLAVSIAAGITAGQLSGWLGGDAAVGRAMPNTPSLLAAGTTGLHANAAVADAGRARAQALLATTGDTVWLEHDALTDAVTAGPGSGPAYIFLLAEAMEDAARAQGLPAAAARLLVQQTILGAARMLTGSEDAPAELRRRVTSPGGTTQAAIERFEEGGLRALVAGAIDAAARRGRELSAANA